VEWAIGPRRWLQERQAGCKALSAEAKKLTKRATEPDKPLKLPAGTDCLHVDPGWLCGAGSNSGVLSGYMEAARVPQSAAPLSVMATSGRLHREAKN
jgi:hypothetical protein